MAKPTPDPETHAGLRLHESDERLSGRSRIASGALVFVLLAVSVFAVWTSQSDQHRGEPGSRGQPPVGPLCASGQRGGC